MIMLVETCLWEIIHDNVSRDVSLGNIGSHLVVDADVDVDLDWMRVGSTVVVLCRQSPSSVQGPSIYGRR